MLAAKGIEHECVNINLKDKPEWFFELNPVGKVPVIELPGGKVIYESAICCGKGQGVRTQGVLVYGPNKKILSWPGFQE